MDREIDPRIVKRQQRKRWIPLIIIVVGLVAGIFLLRKALATSVSEKRLRTAVAERGIIENTLTAAGEVIPAFEQVVTSPLRADIRELLVAVGEEVQPGQPLMKLDKSFALLAYEKLQQELELKRNSMTKLELKLEKTLFDLQITDSIKALRINQLQAELDDAERLKQIGGGTQEEIEKASLELRIAGLEKQQLEHNLRIQERTTVTDLKELEIQSRIQENAIQEMEEKLSRAEVVALRPGVLTWINENIGSAVSEGESLARIADLRSFKVLGSCSDIYAERLRTGMRVTVRLNEDTAIPGVISNIRPTVENNVITFDIQLDQKDHPNLRPNQRVEVFIITASRSDIIRIAKGPAFKGRAQQSLFVLEDGKAHRREVRVGLSNYDYVEIENNLAPGEVVIISDMTDYEHLPSVRIN